MVMFNNPFYALQLRYLINYQQQEAKDKQQPHGKDYARMDRYFVNEKGSRTIRQTSVKTWSRIGQVCNSTRGKKTSCNQDKNPSLSVLLSFLL
jgi:hypothetical protein